ncbi:MAG: hypothetical protein ACE5IM_09330 [Nitrospinota bacterium]
MKSARELAMEKTAKWASGDRAGLSDEQKKRIAEIEAEFRAKGAEAEIMLEQKIRQAWAGDPVSAEAEVESLREAFRREQEALEAKKRREIESVRGKKTGS